MKLGRITFIQVQYYNMYKSADSDTILNFWAPFHRYVTNYGKKLT